MANHTIELSDAEESIYEAYLLAVDKTDAEIMAQLKGVLTQQVVQAVNETGANKFYGLNINDKISFIQS